MLTRDGVTTVGSQTIGYTEREVYLYWDVAPDLRSERFCFLPEAYYVVESVRYTTQNYIEHIYTTRWMSVTYKPTPITERNIFVLYAVCTTSERTVYYYPDTGYRFAYAESIYTQTPLLLKYPKYYNWDYVPQSITPEFEIWSYYPLREDDITLKIVTNQGKTVYINSGDTTAQVDIIKETDKVYKIKFKVDEVFDPGEQITCYLSAYDIKGNYLKDGMW